MRTCFLYFLFPATGSLTVGSEGDRDDRAKEIKEIRMKNANPDFEKTVLTKKHHYCIIELIQQDSDSDRPESRIQG